MKKSIGVDLGGTSVRTAIVDSEGKILKDLKESSYAKEGPSVVLPHIADMIDRLGDISDCEGIGIGVPGPVDEERKVMTLSTNLPGFTGYPITAMLEERFRMPVYVGNDANAAGLAEALVGAGKGRKSVYYITQSTGIGGALIINGKVVSGRHGYAGEIGNIVIDRSRPKINGLNAGAAENEASGTAIGRYGREKFGAKNAIEVFGQARKGNADALAILDRMSYDFAQLMSSIAHVVDPDIFVIGGGCSNASDLYFGSVRKYFDELVHPAMRDVEIAKAELAEPGVLGAAFFVE